MDRDGRWEKGLRSSAAYRVGALSKMLMQRLLVIASESVGDVAIHCFFNLSPTIQPNFD